MVFEATRQLLENYQTNVQKNMGNDRPNIADLKFVATLLQNLDDQITQAELARKILSIEQVIIKTQPASFFASSQKTAIKDAIKRMRGKLIADIDYPITENLQAPKPEIQPNHSSFEFTLLKAHELLVDDYVQRHEFGKRHAYKQTHQYSQDEIMHSTTMQESERLIHKQVGQPVYADFKRNVAIDQHPTAGKSEAEIDQAIHAFTQDPVLDEFIAKRGGQSMWQLLIFEFIKTVQKPSESAELELGKYAGNIIWSKDENQNIICKLDLTLITASINGNVIRLDKKNKLTDIDPDRNDTDETLLQSLTKNSFDIQMQDGEPQIKINNDLVFPALAKMQLTVKLTNEQGKPKLTILELNKEIYTKELIERKTEAVAEKLPPLSLSSSGH